MTKKEILQKVGGLSAPSKMPCSGYSIPAQECKVGAKLRSVKGSTCEKCYAMKGRYLFGNVKNALYRRLEAIQQDDWVENMVSAISQFNQGDRGYFRWHDAGDIQSTEHLTKIVQIADALPRVRFWLPTREIKMIMIWKQLNGEFPKNLVVRTSAHMIDAESSNKLTGYSSGVHTGELLKDHYECPAYQQNGQCGACRACWYEPKVSYPKH